MSTSTKGSSEPLTPYGSAHDLPSFQEMYQQMQGAEILTRVVARDQRPKIIELEQTLKGIADTIDRFYELLGERNWIFHDSLNLAKIQAMIDEAADPETGERQLIELYRDTLANDYWIMPFRGVDGFRERCHQIERAYEHYAAGHFDSCVLQVIAVMDGFVNDFEPGVRKGLHARDPDDMTAWDSVVGHHMGLTNVMKTFRKPFKKRIDHEVFEVYRNGIVHGNVVHFDNIVVATKAWNMLFAVMDWAKATIKAQEPVPPEPSFRETLWKLQETRKVRDQIDAWEASTLTLHTPGFTDHEMHVRTSGFLNAWSNGNYGALAEYGSHRRNQDLSKGQLAGEMRGQFDVFELQDYQIIELENSAPAIWLTRGVATMNGEAGTFECRWVLEDDDGNGAFGQAGGTWRLVFCDPTIWRRPET